MENLINKYKRYNRQFWCWWITDVLTVVLAFAIIFSEDVSTFAIICQITLTVISIVFLVICGSKKSQVVRDMVILLSRELYDPDAITDYLTQKGVSKREALPFARTFFAAKRQVEHKEIPIKLKIDRTCPNCGSTNISKAKSSLDEFFWVIVILSALGNTISSFAMIAFGICWVMSIITSIINKLSGNDTKKMVCKSCKAKFEIGNDS